MNPEKGAELRSSEEISEKKDPEKQESKEWWERSQEEKMDIRARQIAAYRIKTEKRGEPYDKDTIVIGTPEIGEDIQLNENDLRLAEKDIDNDEEKVRRFLDKFQKAEEVVMLCRRFVHPEYGAIRFSDHSDADSMLIKELFYRLAIPKEKLKEIYEYRETIKEEGGFTGHFTKDGKQKLANLLSKPVELYFQPSSEPVTDPKTKELFTPEKT